ncbi:MAG: hypothetical protein C0507_05920 [Cyanobacteria bacterium PR.3.49]|nr:hypothetical protein [Cyanobacteria bacterium PR.3.49]
MSGLLAAILPVYRAISDDAARFQLKNFAEAAADYVVAQLNDPDFKSAVSPPEDIGEKVTVVVAAGELGLPGSLSATVTIANEIPTTESRLFNPSLSPFGSIQLSDGTFIPQTWSYFANGSTKKNTAWRTVRSVVSHGSIQETISLALVNNPYYSKGSASPSALPFFNYAGLGTQTINFGNGSKTVGIRATTEEPILDISGKNALGGDIAAYHQAKFSGTNMIGGSLSVPSIKATVSAEDFGSTTINRYLTVNETAPSFTNPDVLGASTAPTGDYPPDARSAIQDMQSNSQAKLPPAPGIPKNSTVSVDGDLVLSGVSNLSGNHSVTSMSMSSGSIQSTNTSIYIRDNGSTGQVMNLNGNVNTTVGTNPAEFQVWYNGRGKISIKTSDMRGTIYAPNAEVDISSPGSEQGHFKGAIVARDLKVSNMELGFDKTTLTTNSSLKFDPSQLTSSPSYKVVGYKEVTKRF